MNNSNESIVETLPILNFEDLNNELNGWTDFSNYLDYNVKIIITHKIYIMSCYIRIQNDIQNASLLLSFNKNFE
jgi:hypothetical protein